MNISVDGGGLCAFTNNRFGTYTFTKNLLKALYTYDKKNNYSVYTFCDLESNMQSNRFTIKQLKPSVAWMKGRVSVEEYLHKNNVFLALNQSLPLYTKAKKIVFSHGLSYVQHKELYLHEYNRLNSQLNQYTSQADIIITSSVKVKDELIDLNPKLKDKVKAIPFGLPTEFESFVKHKRTPIFFFSGMNHPIKQVQKLVEVFNRFIEHKEFAHFRLYLSGPFLDYASDNIIVITHQSAEELLNIYRNATAYLSASLYESFNFPILEALSQECPVIAWESAVIPELKKYVNQVRTDDEMLDNLIQVANGNSAVTNREEILKKFSWNTYVDKLVTYYT